jgi:hypothetical protein
MGFSSNLVARDLLKGKPTRWTRLSILLGTIFDTQIQRTMKSTSSLPQSLTKTI